MTNNIAKIRAALEMQHGAMLMAELIGGPVKATKPVVEAALAALAELEKTAAEPVAWMWNDELGIPHASAGSKKPIWLESSASAEYIKQANLRPLYAAPPAPVAEIREPTPEECRQICDRITQWANRRNDPCSLSPDGIRHAQESHGRAMFDAVRAVMWPKSEGQS